MKINVSSLKKAILQLEDALKYCGSDLAKQDAKLALHLRAAAIQAFEFTYELSLKMLKRYLSLTELNPNIINEVTFNELIRKGYEKGLLQSELSVWKEYRRERGTANYSYNEENAQEVFENIPAFLNDTQFLLDQFYTRQV